MRLRPSPLIESASTFAVSFLLVLGWYAFERPQGSDIGSMAITAAILVMFPIFTAMTVVGFIVRSNNAFRRFVFSASVALVWSAGAALMFYNGATSKPAVMSLEAAHVLVGACILVAIASLLALAVTYRFVIDDNKVKLKTTQYSSNPSVAPRTTKRKKK